jgi:uracil-DNA glycosylase family 4
VPGLSATRFGDPHAHVVVVGLAPAAHGANRTGRMFTGDRSGDFLFASMHRTGFASQPTSVHADDGLTLADVRVTAPVRCAPPGNAPTPTERRTCGPWLARELDLVRPAVAVVLGGFGWQALLTTLAEQGWEVPRPRPRFAHGAEVRIAGPAGRDLVLLGCFHVSQQNTFTGRLTPQMLDAVMLRARDLAGMPCGPSRAAGQAVANAASPSRTARSNSSSRSSDESAASRNSRSEMVQMDSASRPSASATA